MRVAVARPARRARAPRARDGLPRGRARASGSRRPSARTPAARVHPFGRSARALVPRHPRRAADDGPVLALELRAWAPRRRLCRVAALRARQLPQVPACGRWVPRGWQTDDAVPRPSPCGPLQLRVALGHALPEGTRAGVGVRGSCGGHLVCVMSGVST